MNPAKLLADAKNASGDKATEVHRAGDFATAHKWKALAIEIDRLLRDAVELMARG